MTMASGASSMLTASWYCTMRQSTTSGKCRGAVTGELLLSDLSQMEMDKLCVVDHYPSDRFTFSSHGYDLHIENELVADAFAGLSVQEQSILILHFVLDLPDQEVGRLVGMSRSAVQRRRAKSLTELRIKLAALMPKGG